MHCTKKVLLAFLVLASIKSNSQDSFESSGESSIAFNHDISNNYALNFSIKSRYFLYQDESFQFNQQQLDFVHFSTFKLNINHAISLGIQYRNRELFHMGTEEIRFTQQFNYKKQKLGVRYGHRFRSEQRILNNFTIYRQRYRFAVDFPLNGEKLDIGEAYFVGSLEALLSLSKANAPETDHRTTLQIGWQLNQVLKLQTGLEHRMETYNIKTQHRLFMLTSAIFKI